MIGFFIAILSGACMSVQGVFNSQLTKTTGMWVSNGWVQFTAFVVCITAWIITGRDSEPQIHSFRGGNRSCHYMDCN